MKAAWLAALMVFASTATVCAEQRSGSRESGTSTCRFTVPADLPAGNAEWIGPCRNGRADVLGIIRVPYRGAAAVFYGTAHAGRPVSGVLQAEPGGDYRIADRFDDRAAAVADRSHEMDESLRSFEQAARASEVAAAYYTAHGNGASARYYTQQASRLRKQFDH